MEVSGDRGVSLNICRVIKSFIGFVRSKTEIMEGPNVLDSLEWVVDNSQLLCPETS